MYFILFFFFLVFNLLFLFLEHSYCKAHFPIIFGWWSKFFLRLLLFFSCIWTFPWEKTKKQQNNQNGPATPHCWGKKHFCLCFPTCMSAVVPSSHYFSANPFLFPVTLIDNEKPINRKKEEIVLNCSILPSMKNITWKMTGRNRVWWSNALYKWVFLQVS